MAAYINAFFEERVQQLFDLADVAHRIFSSAGLEYGIVGGVAVYLYVAEREPDAGRLTRDVDVAIRRADLGRIVKAAAKFGFEHRHVAGVDMLARAGQPSARRAIHLCPEGIEPGTFREIRGLRLIPLADLVRMNLTSFRLKDQTHLKDMDEAGLITVEIEAHLPPALTQRRAEVRAHA